MSCQSWVVFVVPEPHTHREKMLFRVVGPNKVPTKQKCPQTVQKNTITHSYTNLYMRTGIQSYVVKCSVLTFILKGLDISFLF